MKLVLLHAVMPRPMSLLYLLRIPPLCIITYCMFGVFFDPRFFAFEHDYPEGMQFLSP